LAAIKVCHFTFKIILVPFISANSNHTASTQHTIPINVGIVSVFVPFNLTLLFSTRNKEYVNIKVFTVVWHVPQWSCRDAVILFCLTVTRCSGTKRFDSEKAGDREVQRTMLELLNQLDGFQPNHDIKVGCVVVVVCLSVCFERSVVRSTVSSDPALYAELFTH